ncbi:hypothetical protein [Clostridium lundense]|uniref:hypothetical protein n=1 Tax=Clostridium lundense TaxID=319475 RepID=UPI000B234138|nr:hypothetical protein [Clostridium lundense]
MENRKPKAAPNSLKTVVFNNICDFCKELIYAREEICRAEGYENYIHKKCFKKNK